jgi:metal-dependent amidase/aminoacylase/carboxypeptidase family protein
MPWRGIDPLVTAAQIVLAPQTIVSRQRDPTISPSVLSILTIHGGVRRNIVPSRVEMQGALRMHSEQMRADIHQRIERTTTSA